MGLLKEVIAFNAKQNTDFLLCKVWIAGLGVL